MQDQSIYEKLREYAKTAAGAVIVGKMYLRTAVNRPMRF